MKLGRVLGVSLLLSSALAFADTKPAAPAETEETYNWQVGPKALDLGHEVELALPANFAFLGKPDADRFLKKNGSFDNESTLGVVISTDEAQSWGVIIDYDEPGHIDDSEKIDAPELLKAIREGTEEQNKQRVEHGFDALTVGDWSELPHYDKATHRLVWALPATSKTGTSINYNTRMLGRRGYVSLNLITGSEKFAAFKGNAATLLAATSFKKGARYEDFDKKTDKVAEYGLMGLILGGAGLGAAKLVKIGLLAKFWKVFIALLLAGKKLVIALFVLIGAGIKKIFGKKDQGVPPPAQETKLPPPGSDGPPPSV
jgi:uncharacterized membrane-anchored protein